MSSPSPELNPHKTHIVRAGAGAGKTRALTLQVMAAAKSFRAEHGKWPRIVVTTFTRKATQELRERLMLQALDDTSTDDSDLVDFVNSRSHLTVATIHGVLDLYLKRYGGQLKIDPNYRVLEKIEASHFARKALRTVLFENEEMQTLLELFDFRQLASMARQYHELRLKNPQAASHTMVSLDEAYRVVAGGFASSLKEIADSIQAEAQGPQQEAWLDVAQEFLRAAHVLAQSESREFVREIFAGLQVPRHNAKAPSVSAETKDRVLETRDDVIAFLELQDPALWPLFVENFTRFEALAQKFSHHFVALKVEHGALEMSDLELFAMESLRKAPQTAAGFADEWDFWLIDEYQDTSPFQVALLRELMGEKPAFIVGDPQQSIYLFRGARSEVFTQKEAEVLAKGGERNFLTTNYRSRPELLLFFNDLFGKMTPPFSDMQVHPEGVATGKDVATIFIAPKPERKSAPKTPPQNGVDTPDDAEIEAITAHVLRLLADGAKLDSICILARTHKTLGEVSLRLAQAHVPVHVHAAAGFYERREIQDALAILRFLLNPLDNVNLVQVLRSPWFHVPDIAIAREAAKNRTLWPAFIENAEEKPAEFEAISRLRSLNEQRARQGLTYAFRDALIQCGLFDSAQKLDPSGRREANLWKLLTRLHDEEALPGFNPLEFVNAGFGEMTDSEGGEESDAVAAVEPNRVNLMTVHASKGLAFDHVIVPRLHQAPRVKLFDQFLFDEDRGRWSLRLPLGVERKSTPSIAERVWLQTYQEHERREHARVLYVALTRARESVFLSFTGSPMKHSWAELMRLDLSAGVHQTGAYTYRVLTTLDAIAATTRREEKMPTPRAPWAHRVSTPTLKSVSVSRLLDPSIAKNAAPAAMASASPIMPLAASLARQPQNAAPLLKRVQISSQGTAVHKLMETLAYLQPEQVSRLVQHWFPQKVEQMNRVIEWMGEQTEPPLLEIIAQKNVEWGFAFLQNDVVIEGQIDLWGRTTDAKNQATVWVLDYKTGGPQHKEQAFRQLALYALALRRGGEIQNGDLVKLAVVYPFAEKIEVRSAPPEAAIIASLKNDSQP